jgi:hypothetical protein
MNEHRRNGPSSWRSRSRSFAGSCSIFSGAKSPCPARGRAPRLGHRESCARPPISPRRRPLGVAQGLSSAAAAAHMGVEARKELPASFLRGRVDQPRAQLPRSCRPHPPWPVAEHGRLRAVLASVTSRHPWRSRQCRLALAMDRVAVRRFSLRSVTARKDVALIGPIFSTTTAVELGVGALFQALAARGCRPSAGRIVERFPHGRTGAGDASSPSITAHGPAPLRRFISPQLARPRARCPSSAPRTSPPLPPHFPPA